jgi:hypothetical protein
VPFGTRLRIALSSESWDTTPAISFTNPIITMFITTLRPRSMKAMFVAGIPWRSMADSGSTRTRSVS